MAGNATLANYQTFEFRVREKKFRRMNLNLKYRIILALEKIIELELPYSMEVLGRFVGASKFRLYRLIAKDRELNKLISRYKRISCPKKLGHA